MLIIILYVNYYSLAPSVCVLGVFLVCFLRVCVLSCFDVVVFVVVVFCGGGGVV